MMVDGSEIVVMPGTLLAWVLIGFCALLVVAVAVTWLAGGFGQKNAREDHPIENLGLDELNREIASGQLPGRLNSSIPSIPDNVQLLHAQEEAMELERKLIEEQERRKAV